MLPSWPSCHLTRNSCAFRNICWFFMSTRKASQNPGLEDTLDERYQPNIQEVCWVGRRYRKGFLSLSQGYLIEVTECSGGILLMKYLVKRLIIFILLILLSFIEYRLCARPCVTYENTMTHNTRLLLLVFFLTALLYNSHDTQFIHVMCKIHWFLEYSQNYTIITIINFRTFLSSKKGMLHPQH